MTTWQSINQNVCNNKTCQEQLNKLNNTTCEPNGTFDDIDFVFVHCNIPDCHDISPGKTSFACELCEKWFCQHHKWTDENFEWYNFVCMDCLSKLGESNTGKIKLKKKFFFSCKHFFCRLMVEPYKLKVPVFRRRTKPKDISLQNHTTNGTTISSPAVLRVQRDLSDLELGPYVTMIREDEVWMYFEFVISPHDCYWEGGKFTFMFHIPPKYPFEGPKVECKDKIYHPNIDLEGKICLNVLRPWKPIYTIQTILFGLLFLFSHPNPIDPLNIEAAEIMRNDLNQFKHNVRKYMDSQKRKR